VRRARLLAVAGALLLLGACGGDDSGSSLETLTVTAVPGYRFQPAAFTVPEGRVEITLVNTDQMTHSVVVADQAGQPVGKLRILVAGGRQGSAKVRLDAGSYVLICDVPGHLQQGQLAPLTVTPKAAPGG
jgi:plastocyanin